MIAYVDASVVLRVILGQPNVLPEWRKGARKLHHLDLGVMARSRRELTIAGQERSIECFCECQIRCVICSKIVTQLPDPLQQHVVRISGQRDIGQIPECIPAASRCDNARRCIASDYLCEFDVDLVVRVK